MTRPVRLSDRLGKTRPNQQPVDGPGSTDVHGFVSVADAAAFLGLGQSTVYAMIDKGLIPHAQFGRSKRVPKRFLVDTESEALRGRG